MHENALESMASLANANECGKNEPIVRSCDCSMVVLFGRFALALCAGLVKSANCFGSDRSSPVTLL